MKKYDVLVIGAGTGLEIVSFAASKGMKVALVEEGPMGGTCLNRGCIPSKMLIHSADIADVIRKGEKFGIKSNIEGIDFPSIIKRVSEHVDEEARLIEESIKQEKNITLYKLKAKFVGEKTMQVGDETISADKVFIVGGSRPMIPSLPGLDTIPYITSKEALRLEKQPEHMVVIGGGYIACELSHLYGSLGTKVTILVRKDRLLENEDFEISTWFTKEFQKGVNINVLLHTEAENFSSKDGKIAIKLKGKDESITADQLLMATGIHPNTDILDVKATGIKTNEKGYIKINDYFETNVESIWALGDIVGILPFKHTANDQVGPSIRNALFGKQETVDYNTIPHAVFSSPQVAGVGKTEDQLKKEGIRYRVGRYELKDTGMGGALQENGLVKILVDEEDNILGGHIVGPDASVLIHEIVIAMKTTGKVDAIANSVYVHPALSEWVQRAFLSIE